MIYSGRVEKIYLLLAFSDLEAEEMKYKKAKKATTPVWAT
jgi:hypothetical protein